MHKKCVACAAPVVSTAMANAVSSGSGTVTISGLSFGTSSPTATASLATADVCSSTAWTSATTVACAPQAYSGSAVRIAVSVSAVVGTVAGPFSFDGAWAAVGRPSLEPSPRSSMESVCTRLLLQLRSCLRHKVRMLQNLGERSSPYLACSLGSPNPRPLFHWPAPRALRRAGPRRPRRLARARPASQAKCSDFGLSFPLLLEQGHLLCSMPLPRPLPRHRRRQGASSASMRADRESGFVSALYRFVPACTTLYHLSTTFYHVCTTFLPSSCHFVPALYPPCTIFVSLSSNSGPHIV
jgi:hypothetical protein